MTWRTFVFLPLAMAAFGYAGLRFYSLIVIMLKHKAPSMRSNQLKERFRALFVDVILQKTILQRKVPGFFHTLLFWAFIVITIGTLEQFLSTLHSSANFEFIGQAPYRFLVWMQDFCGLGVLLAVAYFGYRRAVLRPAGLGKSRDGALILLFTGSLKIALFLFNAFLILGEQPWYANAMPLSRYLASIVGSLGLSHEGNLIGMELFKWFHMLVVLTFLCYIPHSKHKHIFFAVANTFFRHLTRVKAMSPINFEDESVQQYGAAKITDLSWKDALDYYSCTECGRCQDLCPAFNTQKPLSPKLLVMDLRANLLRNETAIKAGNLDAVTPIIDSNVTDDVIWACTTCRACEIACPVFIEQTDKIYAIRRNLVMMESRFPTEAQTIFKNMENNATPWAFSSADRSKWADGMNIKTLAEDAQVDVLLWVGCAGSYDERNKKVLRAFASILKKAKIRFAILGNEEKCTGDPARRIGNEYLFQTLAKENVETLNRYNVKKVVTACPHCFNTLKNEYPAFGGNYEVVHHSQYIAKLITDGRIKPTKSIDANVAFHDSCYLGRWNDVYSEPRAILKSLPSAKILEMENHHDQSLCCGAGGGRMWMEEKIGTRINTARTEQALATNADTIASSCPFCLTMLTDGVKMKEMGSKVTVSDIAELVDRATP